MDAGRPGRVRRRGQQRRHRADGDLRHLPAARSTLKGVWPASAHADRLKTDAEGRVTVTVPPLSAVVLPGQRQAPRGPRRPCAGVLGPGRDRDRHRPRRDRGRRPRWRLHPGDLRLAARRHAGVAASSGPTTTPRTASSTTSAGWPRAHRSSTGPSPATTTATSASCPPAPSSGSRSRRPTRGSTSGRSRSRTPSRCPAATAARSAAPPTGTRRATTSSSTLGDDQVWKGTFSPQAGQYAFKAAINRSWDENYGAGGNRNGSDIFYNTDGGEVASTTTTAPTG